MNEYSTLINLVHVNSLMGRWLEPFSRKSLMPRDFLLLFTTIAAPAASAIVTTAAETFVVTPGTFPFSV